MLPCNVQRFVKNYKGIYIVILVTQKFGLLIWLPLGCLVLLLGKRRNCDLFMLLEDVYYNWKLVYNPVC